MVLEEYHGIAIPLTLKSTTAGGKRESPYSEYHGIAIPIMATPDANFAVVGPTEY